MLVPDFCVCVQAAVLILGILVGGLTWNLLLSISSGTAGRSEREEGSWVRQGEDWEPETEFVIIYIIFYYLYYFSILLYYLLCYLCFSRGCAQVGPYSGTALHTVPVQLSLRAEQRREPKYGKDIFFLEMRPQSMGK